MHTYRPRVTPTHFGASILMPTVLDLGAVASSTLLATLIRFVRIGDTDWHDFTVGSKHAAQL